MAAINFDNVAKSACVKTPGVEWDPGTCENVIVSGNSLINEDEAPYPHPRP